MTSISLCVRLFVLHTLLGCSAATYPPLVEAIVGEDADEVRAVLSSGTVDVNAVMSEPYGRSTGVTALMVAGFTAEQALRDELVGLLLDAGAEADTEADDGVTALRIAVQNNQPSTAALLLQAGAGPDGTERSGNPLTIAAQLGHVGVISELIGHGAWLDAYSAEPIDATPLLMAASMGHVATVRQLIEAGADVALANSKGVAPHVGAALQALRGQPKNAYEVVELLLDAGAPTSALEETVLARPPNGIESVELLRRRREQQRADAPRILVEKLKEMMLTKRFWYAPILAVVFLYRWRQRRVEAKRA